MKKTAVRFLRVKLAALSRPATVVLLVCLVLVSLNIIVAQQNRAYTSDDVSWHTTLMSWRPFSGQQAYVGAKDNFIVNLPFIVLADSLVGAGETQLLVASLLMALVNFTLFYLASLYFLKKNNVKLEYKALLPFIWLASFGFGLSSLFLNTVWRDYEIGLSFAYYALAMMYFFGDIQPFKKLWSKILSLIFLFVCSCFVLSDPYFLYFTVAPVALLFIVQYFLQKISRRKLLAILVWSVLTVCISKVLTIMIAKTGIAELPGDLTFPGLSNIGSAFGRLMSSINSIFGAGFSWLSIVNLCMIILIAALIVKEIWSIKRTGNMKQTAPTAWRVFFGILTLVIAIASLAVDQDGIYPYRYLILAVYICILVLSLNITSLNSWFKKFMVGFLLLAITFNLLSTYNSHRQAAQTPSPNARNLQLVATVRNLGLSKGYAGYWDGNINTYYARNINFLPITCVGDRTVPLNFLVNGALFTESSQRTFILVDQTLNPPICSKDQIIAQFGKPAQTVTVSGMSLLVYNYDLISNMQD